MKFKQIKTLSNERNEPLVEDLGDDFPNALN